jgi:hypothetical protein
MPRIFDNIATELLPALRDTLQISQRSDFCVGYFNLRGWKAIDSLIEQWPGGEGAQCRLLVGMQRLAQDELRLAYTLLPKEDQISQQAVIRFKRRLAEEFRAQLTFGAPTDEDEAGLRRLSAQLKAGKVVVKLFLSHTLHAKLYLCFRTDPNNPITGFLGSSNLTLAGLSNQGELNVDVLDHDATLKLEQWFKDRWGDKWCVNITKELIQVIDESWARPECPSRWPTTWPKKPGPACPNSPSLRTCVTTCSNSSPLPCASRPGIWKSVAVSFWATWLASARPSWLPRWPACFKTRRAPLKHSFSAPRISSACGKTTPTATA